MASKFRLFTKRFFIVVNVLVVIVFLLACLAPNLDPQKWWFISILGLGFPFLLVLVFTFFCWWLFVKIRLALISGIALLLGIKAITVFIAFHTPQTFHLEKKPNTIRVATWNVARFIEMKRNNNKGSQTRLRMMEQIQAINADVLCLQEFFHSLSSEYYPNLSYISRHFNYPYYFFSHDDDGDKHFTGSVIFSRYPIIDSGLVRYPRPSLPDALIHADIQMGEDTVRVFTTHLQSLQLSGEDYKRINEIKEGDEDIVDNSKRIFSKIRTGISYRKAQADIIQQVMEDSPFPVIFCADMNDVPNSYSYYTVKGDMQDAFLKKGFGIGRTFTSLSPTLRIDYIMSDRNFRIDQFDRIIKRYSDHYMLVSDMELRK